MKISHLDHFVLTVKDLDISSDFYSEVLGMEKITFSGGRIALKFGNQKINLHLSGKEFEPKALKPLSGSADFCFISPTPIEQVVEELQEKNIPVLTGVVERTGALGRIRSVYFRDPDGNLIEVSNYLNPVIPEVIVETNQ
ncbi:VOC family protein [Sporocytophaga myxococcoides]|uniref:VOC family protein n=1 Tax=Sporocytophaga myxococcoides TaxID=153721 RepID=UPI0003FD6CF3|nr:VOC family protein [Sporocytophaga myxococcoides]